MKFMSVLRYAIVCLHTGFALFALVTVAGVVHAGCSRNNVHMAEGFTAVLQSANVTDLKYYSVESRQGGYAPRSMYVLSPTSTVLGSSVNVAYVIVLFEWVSASFAWRYATPDMSLTDTPKIALFVQIGTVVWSVFLLVITAVYHSSWGIPTNNVILGIITMGVTTMVHVVLALQFYVGAPLADSADRIPDYPVHHNDIPSASPMTESYMPQTRAKLVCNVSVFLRGSQASVSKYPTSVPLRDTTTLRYIEYAITAPLLMLGTQSTIVLNGPIWALQVCYFSMLLCNVLGQAMHQTLLQPVAHASAHGKAAAVLFLVSSWLFFSATWVQFSYELLQMITKLPTVVTVIVSLMFSFYSSFGVAGTAAFFYLYKGKQDRQVILDWLDRIFDILSVAVKVSVAAIILTSDELGPSSFCTTLA